MSKPEGNFDCAALMLTQVKIDQMWGDSQANTVDFIAETTTLNTMIQNQTAEFPQLKNADKDTSVKIVWIADCAADDPKDCTDLCDVGGAEIESDCKEYSITECTKRGFNISEKVFRTSIFSREEVLARQLLKKMKAMDEAITQDALGKLITFKGVNKNTNKPGVVSGNDTYIGAEYVDANLMGYLTTTAVLNRMRNSFLLSGDMLNMQKWMYSMEATNAQNGQANKNKIEAIPLFNDLWNFDQVFGQKAMLLVNKSAYAFVSKNRFSSTPIEYGNGADITMFSIPSKNLPGVVYDVTYKTKCENDEIIHMYSLTARWDLFQNPLPCDTDMTGVLSFICGEAA